MNIIDELKGFLNKLNKNGFPIPLLKDPKTSKASVSLTLVFISFNLVVAGVIGKWSGALGGIDVSQSLNLFMVCVGLYWGRKMQKDPVTNKIEEVDKEQ